MVGEHRLGNGSGIHWEEDAAGKRTDVQVVPGVARAGAVKAQRHLLCFWG